jgi:hypothetical protein
VRNVDNAAIRSRYLPSGRAPGPREVEVLYVRRDTQNDCKGRTGSDRVGKRMEVEPLKNEEGIKTMVFVMMLLDSSCAVVLD